MTEAENKKEDQTGASRCTPPSTRVHFTAHFPLLFFLILFFFLPRICIVQSLVAAAMNRPFLAVIAFHAALERAENDKTEKRARSGMNERAERKKNKTATYDRFNSRAVAFQRDEKKSHYSPRFYKRALRIELNCIAVLVKRLLRGFYFVQMFFMRCWVT